MRISISEQEKVKKEVRELRKEVKKLKREAEEQDRIFDRQFDILMAKGRTPDAIKEIK
ncbi:MAG: hypothetical protein LBU37_09475 [Tannerellaceae bacterium]|jgi:uncharacterized protein YdhG (YjbR/CyaY superfamily)|nr:hypothetical protein [Tannerellaceae bacterium]